MCCKRKSSDGSAGKKYFLLGFMFYKTIISEVLELQPIYAAVADPEVFFFLW